MFSQSAIFSEYDDFYCYYSTDEEADTREIMDDLLRAGKRVACPRVEGRGQMSFFYIRALTDCCPGFRGIPEPVKGCEPARDKRALVIVPGLAFSPDGRRLGYGGGYYDRFLSSEPCHETLALCYDFQIRDDCPFGSHDILMDMILTPEKLLICDDKKSKAMIK